MNHDTGNSVAAKAQDAKGPRVSILMNDMDSSQFAAYGLRSWVLQRCSFDYEIILTLFNDKRGFFNAIAQDALPNCTVKIVTCPRPAFFNISIANNLGLVESTGKYVFFCNADVVHSSFYLEETVSELQRLGLHYACGARMNLSKAFTQAEIREPSAYNREQNFDYLVGREWGRPEMHFWGNGSPWMLNRETAWAIGGFDPELVCYEERNLEDRAMHYLQRKNLQRSGYAFTSIYGYHLYHPRGDLYDIGAESKRRVVDVRARLFASHDETHETVASALNDREAMLRLLYSMQPPPPVRKPSGLARLRRRIQNAAHALLE